MNLIYPTLEDHTTYTDNEILEKLIKTKDNKWFAILYDRYSSRVYNKCIGLTHDTEIAKDLTHDIFIKVFINISTFQYKSAFYTWVYAITYNTCIDYLRKSDLYIDIPVDDENITPTAEEYDDTELMKMELSRLRILLEEIHTDDKMILLMKYQDEMTIQDIGHILNIGESAAKMRINRAKKKIISVYNSKYRHSVYYLNK